MVGLRSKMCQGLRGPAWKQEAQEWGEESREETKIQKGAVAICRHTVLES